MNKLYLICDESGAKGFADNKEQFQGDFGLFAGYLLTESEFEKLRNPFKSIYNKYATEGEKLHTTDLPPEQQKELRMDVFNCIKENNIFCVYEAISVKGYNNHFLELTGIKKEQTELLADRFSFSKNTDKDRLHSELFQALFGKAIAYYMDRVGSNINIEIITDNIEDSLLKEFVEKAKELITPLQKPAEIKAFDKIKNQPVRKTITFTSNKLNDNISRTKFEILVADNEFTLIADVIANSIFYYLNVEISQNPNIILNSKNAIKKHPLSSLFYGLSTNSFSNVVSDIIYSR